MVRHSGYTELLNYGRLYTISTEGNTNGVRTHGVRIVPFVLRLAWLVVFSCVASTTFALVDVKAKGIPLHGWVLVDSNPDSPNPLLTNSTEDFKNSSQYVDLNRRSNRGYSHSVYWVLVELPERDLSQHWWLEYGYPLIDYIDVYTGSDATGWALKGSTGDQRSWYSREVYSPVFYFNLPSDSPYVLVRLQTLGSMQYPLRLISESELPSVRGNNIFMHGLFFGALFIMIFYNMFVFVMSRELAYLYYVCLIGAITVFELAVTGFGNMYFWRSDDGWVNEHVQSITVGFCLTFVVFFTRRFLKINELNRTLDKIYIIAGLISLVLAVFGALQASQWLVSFTALWPIAVVFLIVYASVLGLLKRQSGATLFLLAWSGGLIGAVLFAGQMQGWMPSNTITVNALKWGIILNVTLLSFSLVSQIQKLKQEKEDLQQKANENYQLALIDGLTGIPNRRAFDERLFGELERSRRDKTHIALMMIDIDYFKNFNDAYGHQMGDDTLIRTALVMRGCLRRPGDMLFRYGGEEFSIILADTHEEGANNTAQRIMKEIQGLCIPHKESPFKQVTVSIGLAVAKNANIKPADFIQVADEALYKAKRSGRNTVSITNSQGTSVVNIGDYFKNTPKDTL